MDADHPALKSLYQEEIDTYKRQIDDLKRKNRSSDEKNASLIDKIKELQDVIEKAHIANNDLNTAYGHLHEENTRLQVYQKQQQDHMGSHQQEEQNQLALEQVQRQYMNLTRESVAWLSEKDRLSQRVKFLERECERYDRDNRTLGKQVRHLVKSLEEERGMIIRRGNQARDSQPTRPGATVTALDVIDDNLVTFESIEELQLQNQKLMSLVKDLAEREERRETEIENEDIKRLNSEVESLKSQLENIKNDRERVMAAFNTINKERDLFKILLCKTRQVEHLTPEIFQRMVSIACSAGPAITNGPEDGQDKDAHISHLEQATTKLEREITQLRRDIEDLREKSDEEIKLKTELLEKAHMKIVSESNRADVLNERNTLLETNFKTLTEEFDEARTKFQRMVFEMEGLSQANDELKKSLETERQRRQAESSSTILNEIQSLKSELRVEAQARLQEAESQNRQLQARLQDAEEQNHQLQARLQEVESESPQLVAKLQEADNQNRQLQTRLQEVESLYQQLQARMQEAEGQNPQNEARIDQLSARLSNSETHCLELQTKLSEILKSYEATVTQVQEFQRLRNIERANRVEMSRELAKLETIISQSWKRSGLPGPKPNKCVSFTAQESAEDEHLAEVHEVSQESVQDMVQDADQEAAQSIAPMETHETTQDITLETTHDVAPMQLVQEPVKVTQEIPQQVAQEAAQIVSLEPVQESPQEVTQEAAQEVAQEVVRELAQDVAPEEPQEPAQEAPQEPAQETPQEPEKKFSIVLKRRKMT